MSPARLFRPPMLLAAAAATILATGCAATQHTPAPHRQDIVVARDAANGRTIRIDAGDQIAVILASTYWTIAGSSAPGVVRQQGAVTLLPAQHSCLPGEGCGSLRAIFAALAPGTAVITAHRTTCGEALRCIGSQGRFRLTVIVS